MSALRKLSPGASAVLGGLVMLGALVTSGSNPALEEASAQRVLRRFAPGLLLTSTDGYVLTFDSTTGTWAAEAAAGGGETLAQTLVLGSTTGGTNLALSTGDEIVSTASNVILRANSDVRAIAQNGDVRLATSNDTGAHSMLVRLTGGDAATAGSLLVDGGEGTTAGGPVQLLAGGGTGGAGVGGSVELVAGASAASTAGNVRLTAGDAPTDGIVDVEARLLQVADRAGTGPGVISSVSGQALTMQAGAALVTTATTTATYGAGTDATIQAGADPQNASVTGAQILLSPGLGTGGDLTLNAGQSTTGAGASVFLAAGDNDNGDGAQFRVYGAEVSGTPSEAALTANRLVLARATTPQPGAVAVAPVSSGSLALTGATVPVVTTGRWLGQDESGAVCLADTSQTYTLRSGLATGTVYEFHAGTTGNDFTVQTSGGDTFVWSAVSSPDTSIVSSTGSATMKVTYTGSGVWRVSATVGTLTGS